MLKQLLTIALTLLFLERGFHFDYSHHQDSKTYSICKKGCDNESCFSSIHDCKECLTENNRFFILCSSNHLKKISESSVLLTDYTLINKFLLTNLSGRSPPQGS